MRWATRWASVLVLPEPAPAMTSSGPRGRALADAVLDGAALLGVQAMEVVDLGEHGRINGTRIGAVSPIPVLFAMAAI